MRRKKHVQHDYLKQETGGWKKKWKDKLPVALIFPNVYQLGMSNLGFQLVYDLLNRDPEVVCERIFFPEDSAHPLSVESGRRLRDFPVVFISVSFEDDFPGLVQLLQLGGVEPFAKARFDADPFCNPGAPLVICGGVATFINPEPLAPFIDMFVVGEAEPVLPEIVDSLKGAAAHKETRAKLLRRIAAEIPGCYVPQFYETRYNADGTIASVDAPDDLPPRISRIYAEADSVAGHSKIMSPAAEFSDIFLTELGRGCSRGCRFCAAGFVYRPPRLWPVETILAALEKRPDNVKRIGFLGMEMARTEDLEKLAAYILAGPCSLSFSSLRADAISEDLLLLLEKSDLKSVAIAPDGGSERLRTVINKNISEDDILHAAESLVRVGIQTLKLYFMIGLPTETMEDIEEMIALVMKIRTSILNVGRARGRLSNMILSINSFVPKAWTPFQFHPFAEAGELKKKLAFVRKQLARQPNVRIAADSPVRAMFQAMLARGDRRVGALLAAKGIRRNWRQVCKTHDLRPEFYARRARNQSELFPWEILDHGIDRNYLWAEYRKGLKGKTTSACDTTRCRSCGVCNGL
ncbi:MAG: radical SAM protein [Desulfobulbaceae bacterium]|nr:radical SAM protein [Desulfobulbaceae bacterium]